MADYKALRAMITHGEGSLNEGTEDEGLGAIAEDTDPEADGLDATGLPLPEAPPHMFFDEPPGSDLVDLEEESPGAEGEPGSEGEQEEGGAATTDVTVTEQPEEETLSIRKQVEKALLDGVSREELVAMGYNKRTVQTVASEVKTKLQTRKPVGKAVTTTAKGLPIFAKGAPPEAIIEAIEVPDVSDGAGYPFEQGIKFGMSLVTLGIRMAQELSGIGVMQAKPLLDMAKSMREGEAVAAKNAAGEAAMEAAGLVQQSLMPLLTNIQKSGAGGEGDPLKAMMVRTMEPIMNKVMGGMIGKLAGGTAPAQITQGGQPADPNLADGWVRREE